MPGLRDFLKICKLIDREDNTIPQRVPKIEVNYHGYKFVLVSNPSPVPVKLKYKYIKSNK